MPNLTVAVIAAPDFSKDLGKKGTTSDITFYNLKKNGTTVTLIEPRGTPRRSPRCSMQCPWQTASFSS